MSFDYQTKAHPSVIRHLYELPDFKLPEQSKIAEILSTVDRAIEQTEALIKKQQRIKTGLMADLLTRGIDADGNLRSEATHAFKDSPLGRIPVEWEVKELGEIFDVKSGDSLSENKRSPGPYNVYGGNGITGAHEHFNLKEPHLIIGRVGEYCGSVHISERCSWITDNALICNFYDSEHSLRFWMSMLEYLDLNKSAYSAAQPVVTGGQLKKILVASISKREQQVIQTTLDKHILCLNSFAEITLKLRSLKTGLMQDLLTGKRRVTALLNEEEQA